MNMTNVWEFYIDEHNKHRWRVTDKDNGLIVGASTQGYFNPGDNVSNAKRFGYSDEAEQAVE